MHASVGPLDIKRSNSIDAGNRAGPGRKRRFRCAFDELTVAYGQQVVGAIPRGGRFGLQVWRASRPVELSAPSVD